MLFFKCYFDIFVYFLTFIMQIKLTLHKFLFVSSLTFLIGLTNYSYSQYSTTDKIVEYIGIDRYIELSEKGSFYLEQLKGRILYGYSLQDYHPDKNENYTVITSIQKRNHDKTYTTLSIDDFLAELNQPNFNILLFKLSYSQNKNTLYQLGDSGHVLVLYSLNHILAQLQ